MTSARRMLVLGAAVLVGLAMVVLGLAVVALVAAPVALLTVLSLLAVAVALGTRAHRRSMNQRADGSIQVRDGRTAPTDVIGPAQGSPRPTWTMQWESGPPTSVIPLVRAQVRVVLREWGLTDEAADDVLLVATELVTNAIVHGLGPVRVAMTPSTESVRVEVHDAGTGRPQLHPPDPWRIGGRGMQLVEALSLRWGWTNNGGGTTVWADVPT